MKNATFIAILLTLIMLLLVVGAAAIFLQQGREELVDEQATLTAELAGLKATLADRESDIVVLQSQAESQGPTLASSEAQLQTRSAEIEANEATILAVNGTLDAFAAQATAAAGPTATPTLTPPPTWTPRPEATATVDFSLPFAAIAIPREGEQVDGSENVELLAFLASREGVAQITVVVNGEERAADTGQGRRSFTLNDSLDVGWLQPGENVVEVTVFDGAGRSNRVTVRFSVVNLPPSGEGDS